eukprot:COSAG02_NODE_3211_length_7164_cov_5.234820_1_plen_77_part_00
MEMIAYRYGTLHCTVTLHCACAVPGSLALASVAVLPTTPRRSRGRSKMHCKRSIWALPYCLFLYLTWVDADGIQRR